MSKARSERSGGETSDNEPLFHDMTRAIVWGMQSRAVQVMQHENLHALLLRRLYRGGKWLFFYSFFKDTRHLFLIYFFMGRS